MEFRNNKKIYIISLIVFIFIVVVYDYFVKPSFLVENKIGLRSVSITTNSKNYDEFDKWIVDELNIKSVPCHLFIKDNKVVNIVEGNIDENRFNLAYKVNKYNYSAYSQPIFNVKGDKINLNSYDVVYITKKDCPACEQQKSDELIIFNNNKNLDILTYYIKTSKTQLDCEENNMGCE